LLFVFFGKKIGSGLVRFLHLAFSIHLLSSAKTASYDPLPPTDTSKVGVPVPPITSFDRMYRVLGKIPRYVPAAVMFDGSVPFANA
jgi:hypothetical protein